MVMPDLRRLLTTATGLALLFGANAIAAQPACPSPADAADQGEMRFTVRERPGRPPVLLAEGIIDANMIPRFRAAVERFQGHEIWLNSAGGYADVDREAGHLIRMHGLRTRIPAGWFCSGACTFMFMGGTERIVEEGGSFVVQMFAHGDDVDEVNDVEEIRRSSRMIATQDYDFLIRMGVSAQLLADVMYREPASGGHCLSRAELADYHVTTTSAAREN